MATIAKANVVLSPTMAVLAGFSTITIHTLFITAVAQEQTVCDLSVLAFFGGLVLASIALCLGDVSPYLLGRSIGSVPIVAVSNVYIGKLLVDDMASVVWHEMMKAIGVHILCLSVLYSLTGGVGATGAGAASILTDAFLLVRLFMVSRSLLPSKVPTINLVRAIYKPASMVTVNTILFSGSQAVISKAVASLGIIEIAAHQLGSLINSLFTLTGDVYSMWASVTVPKSKKKTSDIVHLLRLAHVTGAIVFVSSFALIYSIMPLISPDVAFTLHNQALTIALVCSINTVLKVFAGILTALAAFDKLLSANLVCVASMCLGSLATNGLVAGHAALHGIWVLWLVVCVLRYMYYMHSVLHHFF